MQSLSSLRHWYDAQKYLQNLAIGALNFVLIIAYCANVDFIQGWIFFSPIFILDFHLDKNEQTKIEQKTETYTAVYQKLAVKEMTFEFPEP